MPDLATLQAAFAAAILGTDRVPVPDVAADRLAVYRNNALSALADALRLTYPVTERVLGADCFEQSALAFARRTPPTAPVLARYGEGFADFLMTLPALAALPYVADLARLEWAIDQAGLDAAEPGGRGFTLATAEGSARVTLSPSLRLLRLDTAVHGLWLAIRADDEETLASIDWRSGPQFLAIHAEADDVAVSALTSGGWRLCASLLDGQAIEGALAAATADDAEAAAIAREIMGAPFTRIEVLDPS